ncbi:MAG: aspartate aminotransferase family protein [Chloroherpetonaceae bacterium]|nr:aspartate aminotransferase family protein [Chthonomonadaceae bacterium]MDW8206781.1 aspartate aminotransferase family protein [Chloroherpetonaceae bacterium]
MPYPRSAQLFAENSRYLPGGVASLNRKTTPEIAFVRAQGSRIWDADGNEYIDYHAAFAPHLLGHNHPEINAAVIQSLQRAESLMGTGTTPWEGELAQLICQCVPSAERVQITNTGSEATYHAMRLARAWTGKQHVIVMQGGYNGWHDEVACNVMTPLEHIGPRVSPGEYPYVPMSAGTSDDVPGKVHVVNFNDLPSVEWVLQRYPVACLITEPILQNIGVVKPRPGYLQGLRELCHRYGALLVLDEVKTGFRHALGGYQAIAGIRPDITLFGKAIANGYPLGAIAGRADVLELFNHPDPRQRVLIAGTYNAHPVPVAAAIATLRKLQREQHTLYPYLEQLGAQMEQGLTQIFQEAGIPATVARQGSAFCVYFMEDAPTDWHDIAQQHHFQRDTAYRQALIAHGIYHFPLPTKQGSISAAHTPQDIERTLEVTRRIIRSL